MTLSEQLDALHQAARGRALKPGGGPISRLCVFAEVRDDVPPHIEIYAMCAGATAFLAQLPGADSEAAFAQAIAHLASLPSAMGVLA